MSMEKSTEIIITVAVALLLVIGGIMIINRFTRKALTAADEVQIIQAKADVYVQKYKACKELGGSWDSVREQCE